MIYTVFQPLQQVALAVSMFVVGWSMLNIGSERMLICTFGIVKNTVFVFFIYLIDIHWYRTAFYFTNHYISISETGRSWAKSIVFHTE